jgi:hypothetical protein
MQYNLFTIFPLSGPFAEFGFVFIDKITMQFYCQNTIRPKKRYKIMLTVYVLKNGVGRYYILFNFYTQLAESSFLCRFRVESDFLESSKEFNAYLHNIHTFIRPTQWPHSVKRLRMCDIVCWNKSTC